MRETVGDVDGRVDHASLGASLHQGRAWPNGGCNMRIGRRCWTMLAILFLLLTGCAPAFRPVRNPGRRMDLYGFSVLSPQGSGWFVGERGSDPRGVMFGKALVKGPVPTLVAIASAADVPSEIIARDADELRTVMERLMWERYRVVNGQYFLRQYNASVDRSPGAECIRYDLLQDERTNPVLKGKDLEIRVWGLNCLHPANPRLMIKVYYSLRTERGSAFVLDAGTQQEAEAFVHSLS